LSAVERSEVLELWQGPVRGYALDRCLHHWIEAQAARTPEATAVLLAAAGGGALSYGALNRPANQLARRLRALGVAPGAGGGVLAERSLALVIGLRGILRAGAAYLPLEPEHPPQRLAFMAADARIAVLLAQEDLVARLSGLDCPLLPLRAAAAEAAADAADLG